MTTNVLFSLIIIFLVANSVVLFFVAAFMVKLRDDLKQSIADMIDISNETQQVPGTKGKTWDQKFEEEIEEIQRRSRQDRGLVDPQS